jgi:hypothetical protein
MSPEEGGIMNRAALGALMMIGGLASAAPQRAEAQLDVRVVLTWELGDDGWVSYRPAYIPRREVVYYDTPRQRVRVPPGHLPPPGYCRLWYPGVPPGHQPPPERCEYLFHARHLPPGAVIVGSPAHDVVYVGDRGRGRGRGKKGRW